MTAFNGPIQPNYDYKEGLISYSVNGYNLLCAEINHKLSDTIRKRQYVIKELERAQSSLKESIDFHISILKAGTTEAVPLTERERTLSHSLFSAAVISYGKIFSSTGAGRKQFKASDFLTTKGLVF